jgi:hypothetical protein
MARKKKQKRNWNDQDESTVKLMAYMRQRILIERRFKFWDTFGKNGGYEHLPCASFLIDRDIIHLTDSEVYKYIRPNERDIRLHAIVFVLMKMGLK